MENDIQGISTNPGWKWRKVTYNAFWNNAQLGC